ncbi:MAG: helix-turn-helix domain-containing protein [Tannerellaceae bacterium]|nr:helix-turn-helix domain-containing protein [Tannerellaceae bacterium]
MKQIAIPIQPIIFYILFALTNQQIFRKMKFTVIDTQSYKMMKEGFNKFLNEIQSLCKSGEVEGEWMDGQEVCLRLNISKRTLYNYKLRGIIPYSTIGNKSYFKLSDIQKYIEKQKIG